MFVIEYCTVSRLGIAYPTRTATLGAHKAVDAAEASAHILRTTPNVEIISVRYEPVGSQS